MLDQSGYDAEANPAIAALADFAAQRSGIDARSYFSAYSDREGRKAFQEEQASISADLRRVREALNIAATEGVTDADVIAEAPQAFSGRLTWIACDVLTDKGLRPAPHGGTWEYRTGQYFPTEYRKAAATLLEHAIRRVRQARPPETRERIAHINDLISLNERNGGCWFSRDTMRFHGTKIVSGIIRGEFFLTLDKRGFDESAGYGYNVRRFDSKGNIWSAHIEGLTDPFDTKAEAFKAIETLVKRESEESAAD
jgi:uncharacterized protein YukE